MQLDTPEAADHQLRRLNLLRSTKILDADLLLGALLGALLGGSLGDMSGSCIQHDTQPNLHLTSTLVTSI